MASTELDAAANPTRHPIAARIPNHWGRFAAGEKRLTRYIGPGWITGASDDDPSGIATYSQAGAQFGYGMTWVMLFTFPLMAAIQEISARIGRVTGEGIAGNIRAHYPPWLLRGIVALLLIANVLNLSADLGAMGAATHLLVAGPAPVYVVAFAVGCALLEVFARYERYASILKWTSISLFAYVATALVVDVPWGRVAISTVVPSLAWDKDYIVTIVAVLGTTITPYCFFWQSSEEAEEERINPSRSCARRSSQGGSERDQPHSLRYLDRHGFFQYDQLVHYRHDGGDFERPWHHRHPNLRASGGSASVDRRRLHFRDFCRRHNRHRTACSTSIGRFGSLRPRRSLGMADRACAPTSGR